MPDIVEYCVGNVDPDGRKRLRNLDCRTVEQPCLQRCGSCFTCSLLVVDGEARLADSLTDQLATLEGV